MKYRCLPLGICSWDFRILRDGQEVATTSHDWITEQGTITIDGTPFRVTKHGMMSGRWSLAHNGETLVEAHKGNAFTRCFELRAFGELFDLSATLMSRRFTLRSEALPLATIGPDHMMTRRSWIDADEAAPIELVVFSFWLAITCWKRQAQSSSGG